MICRMMVMEGGLNRRRSEMTRNIREPNIKCNSQQLPSSTHTFAPTICTLEEAKRGALIF